MGVAVNEGLRERREAIVLAHVAAENRHDVGAAIATFHDPNYKVNGQPVEGEAAVRELLQGLMDGLPDFHAEIGTLHHADDAVFGEARITGTHNGEFNGIPPTGKPVDIPMAAIFEFDGDRLFCETVYWDFATLLTQIGILPAPE
jgi:steroid delta-isomerase-like uncharacterized protein